MAAHNAAKSLMRRGRRRITRHHERSSLPARTTGGTARTSSPPGPGGVPLTVADGGSIDGVSCAAQALRLPGGDVACVGVVVPLPRLPRGLLAPPDIDKGVPRYFQSNTFRKEWIRRHLDLISNWKCPIMILQGREDPFQPHEYFEHLADVIPNSTVEFVAAGHYFPHEAPEETTEKIAAFLAE